MVFSTIAAVSTPRGKGGVALLRVSGPDAFAVASRVFYPMDGKDFTLAPRKQIYGEIRTPDGRSVLDDGLLCAFPAPHSFTGEDVVEICCHGGEVVTASVLEALLTAGAVMAGPGEFSRRAHVNGKMSLSAAEGIADLLDAKTREAVVLSSKHARGAVSEKIAAIAEKLTAASSSLWAYLDYPEEDLQSLTDEEMTSSLSEVLGDIRALSASFRTGRAVNNGIPGVIVGKPNAGKSTFFNALLREERSIVTSIPGTTRDTVDAPLMMGRILVDLSDTAGIRRETDDVVESIGIDRSLSAITGAELIFALFDRSVPFDENDQKVIDALHGAPEGAVILPVLTKCDLPAVLDEARISLGEKPLTLSLKEGADLTELTERVEKAFVTDEDLYREGAVITNARQAACLNRAAERIESAVSSIRSGAKDLATLDLEEALATLLETDGKSAGEKILNEVFSRFCVGK